MVDNYSSEMARPAATIKLGQSGRKKSAGPLKNQRSVGLMIAGSESEIQRLNAGGYRNYDYQLVETY
jgi:hypothetical protein